jgi:chromosome segregation ATPase
VTASSIRPRRTGRRSYDSRVPESENLPDRVAALERDVGRMREQLAEATTDAHAARVLASGADREVSEVRAELRAHTRAISALHDDQVELRAETRSGFARADQAFGQIEQAFATVNAGMARIVGLLET